MAEDDSKISRPDKLMILPDFIVEEEIYQIGEDTPIENSHCKNNDNNTLINEGDDTYSLINGFEEHYDTKTDNTEIIKSNHIPKLKPSNGGPSDTNRGIDKTWNDVLPSLTDLKSSYPFHNNNNSLKLPNNKFLNNVIDQVDMPGTWPRRRCSLTTFRESPNDMTLPEAMERSVSRHNHFHNNHNISNSERVSPTSVYNSKTSDIFFQWEDDNFGRLSTQLANLDKKIQSMTEAQQSSDAQNVQLMRENKSLRDRINFLEEQLHDDEKRTEESLQMEKDTLFKKYVNSNREKQVEIDDLRDKLHGSDLSNTNLKLDVNRHKNETDKFKMEKNRVDEKLEEAEERIHTLTEEMNRYRDFSRNKMDDLRRERDAASKTMEDINCELNTLRSTLRSSGFPQSGGLSLRDNLSDQQKDEMQNLVKRLTAENRDLQDQLDESRAEIFTLSLEEGHRLTTRRQSSCMDDVDLVEELEMLSKDELINYLCKEKDVTKKLRDYIDNILGKIMEENPTLLEKRHNNI